MIITFSLDQPNINTGHNLSSNQQFSVQTPAVKLSISPKDVRQYRLTIYSSHDAHVCHFCVVYIPQLSVFPGENIGLGVATMDELGVAAAALFSLSDDSVVSSNGFQDKVSDLLPHQYLPTPPPHTERQYYICQLQVIRTCTEKPGM